MEIPQKYKNNPRLNYLFLALLLLLMFGFFVAQRKTALGNEGAVGKGSIMLKNGDVSEGLNKFLDSVPPPNPFNSGDNEEFASVIPYPFTPYSKFDITFDPKNIKGFQPNNTVKIKGSFGFISNSQSEINRVTYECQKKYSRFEENKRNIICAAPPIYEIPSFNDVGILAQIWKVDENKENQKQNGDFLIDEFYVANNLEIGQGERKDFTLSWNVPEGLEAGNYYASFFINSYKRFSLLSFPINTFSPISRFDFNVKKEDNLKNVYLDKNNISINGEHYSQVHPVPILEPNNNKITIAFPIVNQSKEEAQVKVKYELFRWTEEYQDNKLKTEEKTLKVRPGEKISESFSFEPNNLDSVYDLRVAVSGLQGDKSMTNVHFSIKNQNRGIFTYLGMVRQNEFFYPMFCLRNAQWEGYFEGKLKISLINSTGSSSNWEKEGYFESQDGRCYVILNNDFKRAKNIYDQGLKISGEVYDKTGIIVDRIEIVHDSKIINPSNYFHKIWKFALLIISIFLLVLFVTLIFINKMKIKSKKHAKKLNKS